MNAETIVPTKETSIRLKAAGFAQDALYFWWCDGVTGFDVLQDYAPPNPIPRVETYAAPVFEEVADHLPGEGVTLERDHLGYHLFHDDDCAHYEALHARAAEAAALLWLALYEAESRAVPRLEDESGKEDHRRPACVRKALRGLRRDEK